MDTYTIVLTVHVLGAALMVGGNALGFLIIRKGTLDLKTVIISKYIGLLSMVGALSLLFSGIWLVLNNKDAFVGNNFVIAKVVLFVAGGFLANAIIKKKVMKAIEEKDETFLKSEELKKLDALGFIILIVVTVIGVYLTANN